MKPILPLFILLIIACAIEAQDCARYYFLDNSEIQMTVYDKKDKVSGKLTYTISGIDKSGGGAKANFTSEMVDEKGKSISKGSGIYKCENGILFVDARVALPGESMSAYKGMDVKAEESFIEYPSSFSEGQSLKDVHFKMKIFNEGVLFSDLAFDEVKRTVVGKETVTTSAGTWECWKITYNGRIKATLQPMNIGIPVNMQGIEWFAPGFGLVKSETTRNGKTMGYMVLTSVKK